MVAKLSHTYIHTHTHMVPDAMENTYIGSAYIPSSSSHELAKVLLDSRAG